jgi:hypothetical protein
MIDGDYARSRTNSLVRSRHKEGAYARLHLSHNEDDARRAARRLLKARIHFADCDETEARCWMDRQEVAARVRFLNAYPSTAEFVPREPMSCGDLFFAPNRRQQIASLTTPTPAETTPPAPKTPTSALQTQTHNGDAGVHNVSTGAAAVAPVIDSLATAPTPTPTPTPAPTPTPLHAAAVDYASANVDAVIDGAHAVPSLSPTIDNIDAFFADGAAVSSISPTIDSVDAANDVDVDAMSSLPPTIDVADIDLDVASSLSKPLDSVDAAVAGIEPSSSLPLGSDAINIAVDSAPVCTKREASTEPLPADVVAHPLM